MMNCFAPCSPGDPPNRALYKCRTSSSARSFSPSVLSRYATASEESASFAGSFTIRILARVIAEQYEVGSSTTDLRRTSEIREAVLQLPSGDHLTLSFLEDADFRSDRNELLRKKNLVSDLSEWSTRKEVEVVGASLTYLGANCELAARRERHPERQVDPPHRCRWARYRLSRYT
jgi:hypothetical protein